MDNDCIGNNTMLLCQLALHLNKPEYIIDKSSIIDNFDSYEECDYCKQWDLEMIEKWNKDKTEVPFDNEKCECHIIQQKYFEEQEDNQKDYKSPIWCPLKEIGEFKIKFNTK